jgi:di/tricarboxylate transporter
MALPQVFLVVVVAVPLALVSLDRLRVDVAALSIAVALGVAQFFGMALLGRPHVPGDAIKAISGFGQPVVLTLLSLFVITGSLEKSGVTRWIARQLLTGGGRSERFLIASLAATTALLSLAMNNLAAGALILPSALEIARRTGVKPSKLLIPVAYGSLLGGSATYFTTANIVVSDLLTTAHPPQAPLHILAFTPTGGLMAVVGIVFLALFGHRWLPDRDPAPEQMMARLTGSDLEDRYQLGERLWEVLVPAESPIAGRPLSESGIGERFGLTVAGVRRSDRVLFALPPDQIVQPEDVLLVVGREDRLSALAQAGVEVVGEASHIQISSHGVSFLEVMPSPHSRALGRSLRELEFRTEYRLTALALFRGGRSYRTDVGLFPLALGDSLLMIGSRAHLRRLRANPDFIVLEPDLADQPVQRSRAVVTVGVLAAAIVASILGLPVYLAMLAGAMLLALTRTLEMEDAYRSVDWQSIMLIAGMSSVSLAMVNTGLARLVGEHVLALLTPLGPLGLAGGAYVLTALLTQVMGGQVTALVTGPITISAAIGMHTDPQAVAVATAIGCSASFFTPIAHPVNLLMITPANYRFHDFFRIGWRLTLVCFVTLIAGMALFWRL